MNSNIDLDIIKAHWDRPETVSLKDKNLQCLERQYILGFLKTIGKVNVLTDIGCGDGIDTLFWCDYAEEVIAYEYSLFMIDKAKKNLKGKAKVINLDLLRDSLYCESDIVITKRCLINLGNFDNQKKAIIKIHQNIKNNGYYIMLECCKEGLNNLNLMRKGMDLDSIVEPYHNVYFYLNHLIDFLKENFYVEKIRYFSTYYFLTRVYNQVLDNSRFKEFDAIARKFHEFFDLFGFSIVGPQFLIVLRKK